MNINDILKKEFNLRDEQINNTIKLIDEGNTIQNAKIVIYDSKNNVIESKDLSLDEIKNGTIETTLKTKTTTKYIVQVIANYKVTDTEIAKDKVLLEKEVPATIYATIQQAEINKTEVEKNKTVTILIAVILVASLLFNILNFITLMKQ